MVVPLFSTKMLADEAGGRPSHPRTSSVLPSSELITSIPRDFNPAIITRVSSLSSAPRSVDLPLASAAQTSARLVMLFDPGGRTVARMGCDVG